MKFISFEKVKETKNTKKLFGHDCVCWRWQQRDPLLRAQGAASGATGAQENAGAAGVLGACLLYTSDAADDRFLV